MTQGHNVPDGAPRTSSEPLRDEPVRLAARPSRSEVLKRIGDRQPVPLEEPSAATVRRMRER